MSRQTTGPFQSQSPNSVAEHKNAAMIECVYVHLQIYLLLVGEVSDKKSDVEGWDRNHGFGESGLLLKHGFLDADHRRTDLSLSNMSLEI